MGWGRADFEALVADSDAGFSVDFEDGFEFLDEAAAKSSRFLDLGSELAMEDMPGEHGWALQVAEAEGQPQVEVEGHGGALELVEGVEIDGEGVTDEFIEEVGLDAHLEVVWCALQPEAHGESVALGESEIGPGDVVAELGGSKPLDLIAQACNRTPLAGNVGDSKALDEILEGLPEVDPLGFVADDLGAEEGEEEPWVGSERWPGAWLSTEGEGEWA